MSEMQKLLFLISKHGTIEGRTRFQKLVFLMKSNAKIQLDFDFIPYYYGPYSSELADFIGSLITYGLVHESCMRLNSDAYRYDYDLTEKGKNFVKDFQKDKNTAKERKRIAEAAGRMQKKRTPELVKKAKAIVAKSAA